MRGLVLYALIPILLLFSVGGSWVPVPQTDQFVYIWVAWDHTVASGEITSPCQPHIFAAAVTPVRCITAPDETVRFVEFGATAAEDLGANEDCTFTLRTGAYDDGGGDKVTSSAINVGAVENAAGTCEVGALTLDTTGEQCTRVLDPTDAFATLSGGGWFDVVVETAGAGTCSSLKTVNLFLVAEKL
jgi:hypothetical protein